MAITKSGAMRLRDAAANVAVAGLIALACASVACAETAKLTQASVQKFISSYPDVKSIAVTQAMAKGKKVGGADNPLMAVVEAASDNTIKGEIDTAAKRHGFRDGKEWVGVARSVGVAYAHMKAGSAGDAKGHEKMEKAIAKIQKNDFLSDKQKKKLIDAMRDGAGAVLEAPPPENVAVVKTMAPEIERMVK